jgi:hypothetical protein
MLLMGFLCSYMKTWQPMSEYLSNTCIHVYMYICTVSPYIPYFLTHRCYINSATVTGPVRLISYIFSATLNDNHGSLSHGGLSHGSLSGPSTYTALQYC